LGFRGGLCCEQNRTRELDDAAVSSVRHAIDAALFSERQPERVPKAERVP
jgi:hypothetical protein